jgi:hypothetical protein
MPNRLPSLIVLLALASTPVLAQDSATEDAAVVQSRSFLNSHPDLRYRIAGMKAYQKSQYAEALRYFRLGAYYADKPSQAMVAEMLWKGEGADRNRVEGYIWMDLAAERLFKDLIIKREQFWSELSADERTQAIKAGQSFYNKYGDAVAKPRVEKILERDRRNITGSRVGFVGTLKIEIPGPGGMPIQINGEDFYQDKFWKPEAYWSWQNVTWKALPTGTVTTSELKPVAPEKKP